MKVPCLRFCPILALVCMPLHIIILCSGTDTEPRALALNYSTSLDYTPETAAALKLVPPSLVGRLTRHLFLPADQSAAPKPAGRPGLREDSAGKSRPGCVHRAAAGEHQR